tara:strand:- start:4651 stop:5205 length:555 start_codon:yes stop_codon:yes gene_type:complete
MSDSTKMNDTKEAGMMCCVCCGTLALIAGCISFLVFGIMFLVQDWDEYTSCSGSEMGPYVIVALVLTWGNGNAAKGKKEDSSFCELVVSLLFYFLLNTGLAIWGGIELWDKSCDDLKNTNLWKFSLAVFILQVISATILLFVPFVFACIAACENKSDNPNVKSSNTGDFNTLPVIPVLSDTNEV